jgi:hypothetical protein
VKALTHALGVGLGTALALAASAAGASSKVPVSFDPTLGAAR